MQVIFTRHSTACAVLLEFQNCRIWNSFRMHDCGSHELLQTQTILWRCI